MTEIRYFVDVDGYGAEALFGEMKGNKDHPVPVLYRYGNGDAQLLMDDMWPKVVAALTGSPDILFRF